MMLRVTAMLATLALALLTAACAQQPVPAAPTSAAGGGATAAPGGSPAAARTAVPQRLTVGLTGIPGDLGSYNSELTTTYIKPAIYDDMVLMGTSGAQPMMATEWRAAGPTSWEFRMRQAKFSNGLDVTAEDVKHAVERPLDPANGLVLAASTVAGITGVEVIGPLAVRVNTRAADPLIPNRLARVEIYPKATFDQMGKDAFGLKPIGSGPFVISNFVPKQTLELNPNPTYWGEKPKVSQLIFRDVPDAGVRTASLRTGEIDVAQSLSVDQVDAILKDGQKEFRATLAVITSLSIDATSPEFKDKRVRQAMSYGVDVKGLITQLLGGRTVQAPGQPVSEQTFGANPDVKAYPHDLARARALMAEAGVPNGFTTRFGYGSHQPGSTEYAQALAAQLQQMGIRTELFAYDAAFFQQNFRTNRIAPLYITGFNSAILFDPAGAIAFLSSDSATSNGRYANPEYDAIFRAQATELDQAKRRGLLQQAMRILNEDPPAVYLWVYTDFWGGVKDVSAFPLQANGIPNWTEVRKG